MSESALSYEEPSITQVLQLTLFLLSLNILNHLFNRWIYCGLISQILIGTALGTPGANFFGIGTERAILQLGYLGLILLVYEGGLATSFSALKENAFLSIAVALTGISLPIGISFILIELCSATPLQAFAAGAALCSTSLGTTFTVLESTDLTKSRLGTILMNAAMLDDVAGLVMIRIISNLGASGSFRAITVVRPLVVSFSLVVLLLLLGRFVLSPLRRHWSGQKTPFPAHFKRRLDGWEYFPFLLQTALLIGVVSAASYAGASPLFAAYLTGALITWWDDRSPQFPSGLNAPASEPQGMSMRLEKRQRENEAARKNSEPSTLAPQIQNCVDSHLNSDHMRTSACTGIAVYAKYYGQPVDRLLKPFFFASIGFSIPISSLFHPPVLWRGLIYAVLMIFAKLCTGLWVLNGSSKPPLEQQGKYLPTPSHRLIPPFILGSAMVARGEIGFLIASLAEEKGIFDANDRRPTEPSTQIYLVVIWAIVICTVLGPISVGVLVRYMKR